MQLSRNCTIPHCDCNSMGIAKRICGILIATMHRGRVQYRVEGTFTRYTLTCLLIRFHPQWLKTGALLTDLKCIGNSILTDEKLKHYKLCALCACVQVLACMCVCVCVCVWASRRVRVHVYAYIYFLFHLIVFLVPK